MTDYGFSSEKQRKLAEKEVGAEAINNFDDQRGNIVSFDDGTEWLIFDSHDEAEMACVDYVREELEDEPSLFTQSWLENFVTITDTDRRIMANEEADFRVRDMNDEELIDEADLRDEYDEIQEKIDEYEEKDKDTSALEDKLEKLVDEARDQLLEKIYDEWYEGLEDPIQFLCEEQGIYSRDDLLKQSWIQIDIDEAAEDAVNTDGVAHFFAGYDGNEVELSDGTVMYRTN